MKFKNEIVLGAFFAFAIAGCGGADMDTDADTAEAGMEADETVAPAGETAGLPAGFELRLDDADVSTADFHVMQMGGGMHFETGPAGVFYDPSTMIESDGFTVSATFNEVGAPPNHREAYGIFIGGADLQAESQRYTYFIVRPTGHFMIKKRAGGETMNVSDGWVASEAVNAAPEGGDVTNALAINAMGDMIHFSINGTEVAVVPAADLDKAGIAGIRINHNLNVMVTNWNVTAGM